jgi:alkanesulfonate monooxygenase SsuD/methylene tetrahydromethanopterin reductase-like flavin-dependent oxidoreductase (luciferase family)
MGDGFFGAGSSTTAAFASQVRIVRSSLEAAGRPLWSFPIAKRVYISIDSDGARARERVNAGLTTMYGRPVAAIEEAAVAGTADDCLRGIREVADAGAELILFTALHDQLEHAEQIAAEIIPRLG